MPRHKKKHRPRPQPSPASASPVMARSTAIKFNQGRTLLHLAGMYPTLLEVILEQVQNALDKDVRATKIWIVVNYKTKHLAVRDNGAGVTVDKFNAALASVATAGRKGEGSLGQFGIGLISPLGKCERFTFISCPHPQRYGFQEWTFGTEYIVNQSEDLKIPVRSREDLTLADDVPSVKTRVLWRSEMSLTGFTTDEFISRIPLDSLISAIQDRYATTMRRNGTVISVEITDKDGKVERRPNVTALNFRGRALPEQTFEGNGTGKTVIRLYVAPKTSKGRNGRVLMGVLGNDFRFPFHIFSRSVTKLIKEEVISALSSGLFEGEILSEQAKLHPGRMSFEQSDAWIALCIAIDEWFDKFGSKCINELQRSSQEERFQDLGLKSMKVLEALLKDPAHAPLLNIIKTFGMGTVGPGHFKKKVVGQQKEPAISIDGNPGVPREERSDDPSERGEPNHENKPHTPLTVTGPKGKVRKLVRGSSFGLQFSYDEMEGSAHLWSLDTVHGVLHFNTRHPLWTKCDKKDTTVMRLQECVTMQALTLEMMPEPAKVSNRLFADELTSSLATWILSSDKARGTFTSRKKTSS